MHMLTIRGIRLVSRNYEAERVSNDGLIKLYPRRHRVNQPDGSMLFSLCGSKLRVDQVKHLNLNVTGN